MPPKGTAMTTPTFYDGANFLTTIDNFVYIAQRRPINIDINAYGPLILRFITTQYPDTYAQSEGETLALEENRQIYITNNFTNILYSAISNFNADLDARDYVEIFYGKLTPLDIYGQYKSRSFESFLDEIVLIINQIAQEHTDGVSDAKIIELIN